MSDDNQKLAGRAGAVEAMVATMRRSDARLSGAACEVLALICIDGKAVLCLMTNVASRESSVGRAHRRSGGYVGYPPSTGQGPHDVQASMFRSVQCLLRNP